MASQLLRIAAYMAVAFALGAAASNAHGQVYKCKDSDDRTIYSDTPCDRSGKPLKLPGDAREGGATPQVCAQLQDEIERLTTASERSGRGPSNRAKTLKKTYRSRCLGITRSPPTTQ
jgi:hypothetical protein